MLRKLTMNTSSTLKSKPVRSGIAESKKKGGYLFNFMVHLNLHLSGGKPFNEAASWLMKAKDCKVSKYYIAGLQVILCDAVDPIYPSYSKRPSWFINPSTFYFSDSRVLMTEKTFNYLAGYRLIFGMLKLSKD